MVSCLFMPERKQHPAAIEEAAAVYLTDREMHGVYSRLSPLYGFWERWAEGRARKLALELARITNGERVLEVAVGPGATLVEILARVDASTVRKTKNVGDGDAVYVVAGGKDGYVGRDGRTPEDEESPRGPGFSGPPGAAAS